MEDFPRLKSTFHQSIGRMFEAHTGLGESLQSILHGFANGQLVACTSILINEMFRRWRLLTKESTVVTGTVEIFVSSRQDLLNRCVTTR